MRIDIEGGLRNAIERGNSLEEATQSFINAGYSEQEVKEAADKVNPSILPGKASENETPSPNEKTTSKDEKPKKEKKEKPKKKRTGLLIFLILILLILIGALAVSLLFREQVAELLSNIL